LHTEQTPASALPFQQFSPSEQKRQLEALTKLDQAARTVVGVFPPYLLHSLSASSHNPNNYYDTHISGSVVVTIANMSNLNHLRNFACFAKRIQMHFLVLAVDDSLVNAMAESKHDYFSVLRYHGYYTTTTTNSSKTETAEVPLANTAGFQSKQLNLISLRKFEAVYDLQRLGYDVLFVDIDVVILQDVFSMLLQPALQEISYLHSMNQPCSESGEDPDYFVHSTRRNPNDGNTGFHFFQHPTFAQQRLANLYASVRKQDISKVISQVPRPHTAGLEPFYRQLLRITETLPVVQMLHIFLRDIPHCPTFNNPEGVFDEQSSLYWLFVRSLRSEQNSNVYELQQQATKKTQQLRRNRRLENAAVNKQNHIPQQNVVSTNAYYQYDGYNDYVDEIGASDYVSESLSNSAESYYYYYNGETDSIPQHDVAKPRESAGNGHITVTSPVQGQPDRKIGERENIKKAVSHEEEVIVAADQEEEEEEEANDGRINVNINSSEQDINNIENTNNVGNDPDANQANDIEIPAENMDTVRENDDDHNDDDADNGANRNTLKKLKKIDADTLPHIHHPSSHMYHHHKQHHMQHHAQSSSSNSAGSYSGVLNAQNPQATLQEDILSFETHASTSTSASGSSSRTVPEEQHFLLDTSSTTSDTNSIKVTTATGNVAFVSTLATNDVHNNEDPDAQQETTSLIPAQVQKQLPQPSQPEAERNLHDDDNVLNSLFFFSSPSSSHRLRGSVNEKNATGISRGRRLARQRVSNRRQASSAPKAISSLVVNGVTSAAAHHGKQPVSSTIVPPVQPTSLFNMNLFANSERRQVQGGMVSSPSSNEAVHPNNNNNNNSTKGNLNTIVRAFGKGVHPRLDTRPPANADAAMVAKYLMISSTGTCQRTQANNNQLTPQDSNDSASPWAVHAAGRPAIEICALSNCQVAPAAFLHFQDLLQSSVKRMHKQAHHIVRTAGAESEKQRNDVLRLGRKQKNIISAYPNGPENAAKFKLTAADLDTLQRLFEEYDGPPRSESNARTSSGQKSGYLYALHGNYVSGEDDKVTLMQDAGFWLVPDSTVEKGASLDFGQCLAFPHKPIP
jgi:hypothetical protein